MIDTIIPIDNRVEFDRVSRGGGQSRLPFRREILTAFPNRLAPPRREAELFLERGSSGGASLKSRKKMLNRSLNRYKRALRDPITVLDFSEP